MPTDEAGVTAGAEAAADAMGNVEPTFFVSLVESMTPLACALAYLMVALFFVHGIVLGIFLLNTFVDASLTTASERAKNLWRTLGVILALQLVIAIIFAVIVLLERSPATV